VGSILLVLLLHPFHTFQCLIFYIGQKETDDSHHFIHFNAAFIIVNSKLSVTVLFHWTGLFSCAV